jgi:uncharacterized protein (TIGR02598 family)
METPPLSPQQNVCSDFCCLEGRARPRVAAPPRLRAGAFSLIEVVLALGVVAFAFVALFGMLPVGLNAFNNSIDSTTEAQIAENVMAQLRQEKFSQLYAEFNDSAASANGTPSFIKAYSQAYVPPATGFYYDDQGNFLAFVQQTPQTGTINPVSTPPSNWIYAAGVQVYYDTWTVTSGNATAPPFGVQPWTSSAAVSTTLNPTTPQPVATVVITIRKLSSPNVARIYTGYIGNNGL